MDESKCLHCGAKTVEYKHNLSKGQIRPLIKLLAAGGGPASITDDLHLIKGEYTNFAKLAYWGLAKKEGITERGGRWQITERGKEFLRGKIKLRKTVWVYRNDVQRFEGDEISVMDVTGGWKYRPQYAREARPHDDQGDLF